MFLRSLMVFLFCTAAYAQNVEHLAPSSPTLFSDEVELSPAQSTPRALEKGSGIQLMNSGGDGKMQTIGLRGFKAADIGVNLEGIRLNSVNSGDFDFGTLSSFGLGSAKIIHGGYSAFSSSPGGEVFLKLSQEQSYKTQLDFGSYETFGIGILTSSTSFSLEQTQNDFPFNSQGIAGIREHNFSQRLNARAWKKEDDYQIWAQLLYSDQELPGQVSFPSQAQSQTLTPTLAYQGRWKNHEWAFWGTYQKQDYSDVTFSQTTTNQWFTTGFRNQSRYDWLENIELESGIEWTSDKLFSDQGTSDFQTPWRKSFALSGSAYIDLAKNWLLHPRVRGEFISDLKNERFSIHPGLGSRYHLTENLDLLSNFSWISRAPNFSEMYFQLPGLSLSNPSLKRQRSLEGDLGYEFHKGIEGVGFKISQAIFFDRTERMIQSMTLPGPVYQVQNLGTALSYGLESYASIQFKRFFNIEANYTWLSSETSNSKTPYKPSHRLNLNPVIFPEEGLSLALPIYMRSKVYNSAHQEVSQQWDLAMQIKLKLRKFEYNLELKNLMAWNREEIYGFPLSNETSVHLSATASF